MCIRDRDTFDVIENDHRELVRVKGVSRRLADSVHAAMKEYAQKKYIFTDLMGMGLTSRQATAATSAPVSYTHLDVYKRQAVYSRHGCKYD